MSAFTDNINLFDRINLADCARRRASANVLDTTRFESEYHTAQLWMKYRCVNTPNYSYIEN
jgi:hypothetical protein